MSSAKMFDHAKYGRVAFTRSEMFKCKIYFGEEGTISVPKSPDDKFVYKQTNEDDPIEFSIQDGDLVFLSALEDFIIQDEQVMILELVNALIADEVYTNDNWPIHVDQSIGEGDPDPDESMTCYYTQSTKKPTTENGSLNNFLEVDCVNPCNVDVLSDSNDNLLDTGLSPLNIQDNSHHPTFYETILSCFGCCSGNDTVDV